MLTRLTQGARLSRASVEMTERVGLSLLRTAFVRAIATLFVRETRFDALHHGETEQILYNGLPRWIAAVESEGTATLELQASGKTHSVTLKREHLVDAAQPYYAILREMVAATTRPGEP